MGEDFDGEVPHAHLSVEVLKLALYHDVEGFEEERVEIRLHLLFALVLLKLLELLCFHPCHKNAQLKVSERGNTRVKFEN